MKMRKSIYMLFLNNNILFTVVIVLLFTQSLKTFTYHKYQNIKNTFTYIFEIKAAEII